MYQVRRSIGKWIIFLILLTFAIAAIYPLFYMLMSSIKTEFGFMNDPIGLPESFYLDNYAALFNRFPLAQIFSNTLVCVLGAFVLSQSLTIPAAFAFAKLQFHNKNLLYTVMVALMAVPGITFIIPNYLLMSRLGLIDNYLSVILLWGILSVPGNVFLMTALMRGLPNEILEAVKIDGATYFQMIFRIVIPISTPGIVTVTIFNATSWYNDLLTPLLYLQSDSKKTITVAVATILGRFSADFPLLLAGLTLTALPPVILYLLLQGYIRKGMVIGAVK